MSHHHLAPGENTRRPQPPGCPLITAPPGRLASRSPAWRNQPLAAGRRIRTCPTLPSLPGRRREPVLAPGRPGPGRAVVAAAGPRASRHGRRLVRVGGDRPDDRVRAGPPVARNLGLPAPGHRHHPASRRRSLCRLRAAGLAIGQRSGVRPDPPVRPLVRNRIPPARHGRPDRLPPPHPGPDHPRALGITTAVSCLPVLVPGMGAALAHLLRADSCRTNVGSQPGSTHTGQAAGKDTRADHTAVPIRPERLARGDRDHAQCRRPARVPALTALRRRTRLKRRTGRSRAPGHIPASQPGRVSGVHWQLSRRPGHAPQWEPCWMRAWWATGQTRTSTRAPWRLPTSRSAPMGPAGPTGPGTAERSSSTASAGTPQPTASSPSACTRSYRAPTARPGLQDQGRAERLRHASYAA
jgi:hypothetical protein